MIITIKPRQHGKTTALILQSAKDNIPIVCASTGHVKYIVRLAKTMGVTNLPDPIPYYQNTKLLGGPSACYIDGDDRILQMLIHARINEATFTEYKDEY
jgi:hypothetical protein